MTVSFPEKLTPLQRALIEGFFQEPSAFRLTGGAALAGFHLGHRMSQDVDLFGPKEADLDEAARRVERVAEQLGARVARIRTSRDFLRMLVSRDDDQCEVDLVRDLTPQVTEPEMLGQLRVDSRREIAANKMAALVSRSEVRDLVDLLHLELSGVDLEQALRDAMTKDAGLSPDTLALSVSWIPIEEAGRLLASADLGGLREFRDGIVARFRRLAFPGLS